MEGELGTDFGVLIPIIAVGGGFVVKIVKTLTQLGERQLEMQMQMKQSANPRMEAQIEALREEIVRLRDTSTSYDLTIDNALQRLEHRIEFLENKQAVPSPRPETSDENVQRLGRIG